MMEFTKITDAPHESWAKRQTEVNINLKCSRWFDWWFGGLHFHIEHHVFPRMPRYNLRLISKDIKALMKDHGVFYDYQYLWNIVYNIYYHLKKVAYEFRELEDQKRKDQISYESGSAELSRQEKKNQ